MKLKNIRGSKLSQGMKEFTILIVGIILLSLILFLTLLAQHGCTSHPNRISLDSVDKIDFIYNGDFNNIITIDPGLTSKIINTYNNSSKSTPKGDMNTPESTLLIYLKNNRKVVINNLDGIEFETHVVMPNGPRGKVFESSELEQIINFLEIKWRQHRLKIG